MIKKEEILSELKKHLSAKFGISIKKIILFGSRVFDKETEFSDYDILILLNDEYSWEDENEIYSLSADIELKYNVLFDIHILSENEINTIRGRQPIFQNAIKYGISV